MADIVYWMAGIAAALVAAVGAYRLFGRTEYDKNKARWDKIARQSRKEFKQSEEGE